MRTVMEPARAAVVAGLAVGLVVSGCSGNKPSAEKCETVSAQLTDVPTRTDQEPKLRVPVPAGWERSTQMDSEQIRFALRSPGLAADGFTPNAVVTLQKVNSDLGKPEQILKAQSDQLAKKLNLTDVTSTSTRVCGAPALSSSYTTPELKLGPKIPPIPPRKATSLGVVYRGGDANYVATVTVQSVKADNPTYVKDSEEILKGFQILPPA
ncbi:LpqN/LpqT family lipoprotein [Mycolicibacterium sp.]|uniref:LpqN/LpqT family lipoprotein n=1 Tax=Mycolicibacterium sp. TaxID=2320850 RepID=UPI0028AB5ECA|nr:LpqN/LpqT family lipoprotein [Mycolicibacterium sp.]